MNELNFRPLKAEEINCIPVDVGPNGAKILLCKSARVDEEILNETVGRMNWRTTMPHNSCNILAIEIYDPDKKEWVTRFGVGGSQSRSENKEKAAATDAMKRAGMAWGIGEELYSLPDIFLSPENIKIVEQNGRYYCNDEFKVDVLIVEDGKIVTIRILDMTTRKVAFVYDSRVAAKAS